MRIGGSANTARISQDEMHHWKEISRTQRYWVQAWRLFRRARRRPSWSETSSKVVKMALRSCDSRRMYGEHINHRLVASNPRSWRTVNSWLFFRPSQVSQSRAEPFFVPPLPLISKKSYRLFPARRFSPAADMQLTILLPRWTRKGQLPVVHSAAARSSSLE
jgi:hypothetical protein